MDICQLSAAELGSALRRGDLSAAEALDAVLRKQWITGMRAQFAGTPIAPQEPPPVGPLAFKMT